MTRMEVLRENRSGAHPETDTQTGTQLHLSALKAQHSHTTTALGCFDCSKKVAVSVSYHHTAVSHSLCFYCFIPRFRD